jgi:hypothetical protein
MLADTDAEGFSRCSACLVVGVGSNWDVDQLKQDLKSPVWGGGLRRLVRAVDSQSRCGKFKKPIIP